MSPKYRKYSKPLGYSYTCGIYPTLELLRRRGEHVRDVLVRDDGNGGDGIRAIRRLCGRLGVKVQLAPRAIARIARENHPVVGVCGKYRDPVDMEANHVVLVHPRYIGNVGAITRSMVGFGLHDLVLIRPAPDIFDPALIRSSMGAMFQMRWAYYDSFEAYRRSVGHTFYCMRPHEGVTLAQVAPHAPYGLVFGSEGDGLPTSLSEVGCGVRIPHCTDIDSLNLAIAAGIVFYHVAAQTPIDDTGGPSP